MSPAQRCDEIIELIDRILDEVSGAVADPVPVEQPAALRTAPSRSGCRWLPQ